MSIVTPQKDSKALDKHDKQYRHTIAVYKDTKIRVLVDLENREYDKAINGIQKLKKLEEYL